MINPRPGADRVVLLGDLIDRGPSPVEVVRYARAKKFDVIMGNHEEKLVRWLRREARAQSGGKPNGMRPPFPERLAEWSRFTEEEVQWMADLPYTLDLGNGFICVHAGFEPIPLKDQLPDRIVRIRWLKEKNWEYASLRSDSLEQPPGTLTGRHAGEGRM